MASKDPLADPAPLIRRVYSYVAYRIGDGPDAEDLTSEVFERALKYRSSYDPARGGALPWLIGIARRCVDGRRYIPAQADSADFEQAAPGDLEANALERLTLARAVSALDARGRELLALRYGADLSARQIATLLGVRTNAVEVALHRALGRVRAELEQEERVREGDVRLSDPAARTSS
jgi:RNA polymerase sigma-70 factor (ECF subfamily)